MSSRVGMDGLEAALASMNTGYILFKGVLGVQRALEAAWVVRVCA